ncbi:penicillin-binding protein activator [Alteromonas oceanisediminis]|uniref:penicillin-binding protein activator n=1 Tax=Alteromonas oceanisediminis TaxID=2836180 RepID=UPI001BDA850E|nr:penicillin-binding protein activator [Alteromonas oceanisediminis]MBT0585462.1 penicillin-binding protein activator [Alteromonas oceanisediminis]
MPNYLFQFISTYRFAALSATVLIGLSGCGSTPTPAQKIAKPSPISTNDVVDPAQSERTAEDVLKEAEAAWLSQGNVASRNKAVVEAAELFLQTSRCPRALTALNSVYAGLTDRQTQILADSIIAECAPQQALTLEEHAQLIAIPAAQHTVRNRQHRIQAGIFERQSQWLAAANALAQQTELDERSVEFIWSFIHRTPYTVQQQSLNRYPALRQWLALSAMLHRYGQSPMQLKRAFDSFSVQNPDHPLVLNVPAEFVDGMAVNFTPPQRIVAVLPLSGRLEAQGTAIKHGILAAYLHANGAQENVTGVAPELTFLDSNVFSMVQIAEQLDNVDLVIGPLLKGNIDELTPLLAPQTVMIGLNRVDTQSSRVEMALDSQTEVAQNDTESIDAHRLYFGLAPEDEAKQMAQIIFARGLRTPIVVHGQDSIGQRLAAAFLEEWRYLTGQRDNRGVDIVSFNDNDGMREGILGALDVEQSKARIRALENILIPELYNVPRNRRDVDAIIAFATPEQTELLNPIIEASLSPFTDAQVPVFTTSRSVSLNVTKNQLRDLQNVHFIDMPWLLPSAANTELGAQMNTLYPNQRDSVKRLFALGFDAYQKIPAFAHLAAIPQLSVDGLSGTLSINTADEVERTLPLAKIDNERVVELD